MIIKPPVNLEKRNIFVSTSFPSGDRGEAVRPYDTDSIADAITYLTRAIFAANGRIVCGGHPTITPLILLIAGNQNERNLVDIYQSKWFADQITEETQRLESLNFGTIYWTRQEKSREESLSTLRSNMLTISDPLCAIFIGGMDGLFEEYKMFKGIYPKRPCMPVKGPGGAARKLKPRGLPDKLESKLESLRYPSLFHTLIEFMGEQIAVENKGGKMAKTKVFISFDFDNDKVLKDFIIGQAKNDDSPFEVADYSLKEEEPAAEWKEKARKAIARSDVFIVMLGSKTKNAPGVLKEVAMANALEKKRFQIIGYKNGTSDWAVPNAGRTYSWDWETLKKLL